MKTRYKIFRQLEKLQEVYKTSDGFQKMIQIGDLSVHDYSTGFLDLLVYYHYNYPVKKHQIRLFFATIDDGSFGAWKTYTSKEKVMETVWKLYEIFKNMNKFPSDEKLNIILRPFGLYVTYE